MLLEGANSVPLYKFTSARHQSHHLEEEAFLPGQLQSLSFSSSSSFACAHAVAHTTSLLLLACSSTGANMEEMLRQHLTYTINPVMLKSNQVMLEYHEYSKVTVNM